MSDVDPLTLLCAVVALVGVGQVLTLTAIVRAIRDLPDALEVSARRRRLLEAAWSATNARDTTIEPGGGR